MKKIKKLQEKVIKKDIIWGNKAIWKKEEYRDWILDSVKDNDFKVKDILEKIYESLPHTASVEQTFQSDINFQYFFAIKLYFIYDYL